MKINDLVKKAHENAVKKGFYDCERCEGIGYREKNNSNVILKDDYSKCHTCNGTGKAKKNIAELLMLTVSELGEALEAHRKGRFADLHNYHIDLDDLGDEECFKIHVKNTFEDEIADTVIRIADLCGYLGIKFDESEYTGGMLCPENIAECLFDINKMITDLKKPIIQKSKDVPFLILDLIRQIEFFCVCNDIDLEKHISLKMRYNETREYKHGKRY